MPNSHKDYERNPLLATDTIGKLLGLGCLNLFLGAGISKGFGLPNWLMLVARILGRGTDVPFLEELEKKSSLDLGRSIDPFDTKDLPYLKKVHDALYLDVADSLIDQLPRSPLLLAVAALLTGNCRGRIEKVFTYNYDDLLEQYLAMLGHATCVRTSPSDYSKWADVEINHVHGYLPQKWNMTDPLPELVLSEASYRNRRAGIDEGWSLAVESSLNSKAALLLGLSGDDTSILDIFTRAKKRDLQRKEDYHGYWLLTPDAYSRNCDTILAVGMCPISVAKDDLPQFVFRVCQSALR